MTRGKATITLDREKVSEVQEITKTKTMSDAIDVALERLIRAERLRRDVEIYRRMPQTDQEASMQRPVKLDLDDDDIDYDQWYGSE